jgi:hypothetical protein
VPALVRRRTPEGRRLQLSSESIEVRAVWFASCLSVTLALVALLPSLALRTPSVAAGVALAVTFAPAYRRRAMPFWAAMVTIGAACFSTATVLWLSGLPWETGISWSRAGEVGRPSAWLFTTTSLCFGLGVLAAGRLILREGYRRGAVRGRGYFLASALPVISFAGFLVVAFSPVGGAPALAVAHNIACVAALGCFWFAMVASPFVPGLSRVLRYYSSVAAVVVFGTWLPSGLRFMGLIEARPISMLAMELVVVPLCFVWFCWLAWEWSPRR